jgi:hypothetical protein
VELDALNLAEKQRKKRTTTAVQKVTASDFTGEKTFDSDDIKTCMAEISKELVEMRKEISTMKQSRNSNDAANSKQPAREIRC